MSNFSIIIMPINIPNVMCLLFCPAEIGARSWWQIIYSTLWPHLTHLDSLANIYVPYIISVLDIWFRDNYTLFGVLPRKLKLTVKLVTKKREKILCGFWIGRFESVKLLYFITFTCESPFLVTAIPLQWETSIRVHRRSVLSRNRNRELKRKAPGVSRQWNQDV